MAQFTLDNNPMTPLDAIILIETDDGDEEETLAAWQLLVDTGFVWRLQGSYGRAAAAMIRNGYLTGTIPGEEA